MNTDAAYVAGKVREALDGTATWAGGIQPSSQRLLSSLYDKYKPLRGRPVYVLFSGGLDTSFVVHFLQTFVEADVTAISVDVGSILPEESASAIYARTRAEQIQVPFRRLDGRPFLLEPFLSCLRAEGQLSHGHHPASSLSRVAIVQSALAFAKMDPPRAIFHGSNGVQNNAFRFFNLFEHCGTACNTHIDIEAPHLDTNYNRELAESYLAAMGLSDRNEAPKTNSYSIDDNVFGMEVEDGPLGIPSNVFDVESILAKQASINCATEPRTLWIEFSEGIPIRIEFGGQAIRSLDPLGILKELNAIGLSYRVGIHDYYEGRPIGIQAREIHVAPGMTLLIKAHHILRTAVFRPDVNRELDRLSQLWSQLVILANLWPHDLRREADALFLKHNKRINGRVGFRLGHQFVDLPRLQLPDGAVPTATPASAEDVASLHDYINVSRRAASQTTDVKEIRATSSRIDELMLMNYDFLSSHWRTGEETRDM